MELDHEKLDVYHPFLDFVVLANDVVEGVEGLPRGRGHLADQLARASTSVVLNLAEGAGKHPKPDQAVLLDGTRLGDRGVVPHRLLVSGGEASRLLEKVECALDF